MAVLSSADRQAATDQFQRENTTTIAGTLTKAQLRAAFDAADSWVDSNAASFNTALPVAARNALSSGQKALLLMIVVAKRFLSGV